MTSNQTRADLKADLILIAFLVTLIVVARLLPHAWGFLPVAASGLFAARMLRNPPLAITVPVLGMVVSSVGLPGDDWRVQAVGVVAIAIPAVLGIWSRRWSGVLPIVGAMLAGSVLFFLLSNFAVWAFSGMYPLTPAGLTQCYVLALPFLEKTVMGDMFWTAVLFGGAWLVQRRVAFGGRAF